MSNNEPLRLSGKHYITREAEEALNELPVIVLTDCRRCGAKRGEYRACNADETGTTNCDQCEKRKQ